MKLAVVIVAIVGLAVARPGPRQLTQEQIERISNWKPGNQGNSWEMSGQFEGDMVMTPENRNGLIDTRYRWPDNTLVYEFDPAVPADSRQFIRDTLDTYTWNTCIRHRERTPSDNDYIYVTNFDTGCWSYVGYLGGRQDLNLQQNGCMWYGTILHEFLHALGFYHQQSATERDDYVDILWENIQEGQEHNFDKYGADIITEFGTLYDYGSIMHYGADAFSKNGQPTIRTHNGAAIGQSDALSGNDIEKVNRMYC